MNLGCWICKHYCQRSYRATTGQRNVSGGVAWYRIWAKHRCNLNQEDKYPRSCDFEEDTELRDELNRRYPDLAAANVRIENGARKVAEIRRKINETVNCWGSMEAS